MTDPGPRPIDPRPDGADASAAHDPQLHPAQVYDRVGGREAFDTLVETFYAKVADDPLLRPIYPDDLEPGKRHLAMFLAQYWGGGPIYNEQRGHPRLRMRHAGFDITPEVATRWAELMSAAIRELAFPSDVEALLLTYVERATPTLINRLPDDVRSLPTEG